MYNNNIYEEDTLKLTDESAAGKAMKMMMMNRTMSMGKWRVVISFSLCFSLSGDVCKCISDYEYEYEYEYDDDIYLELVMNK